MPFYTVKQKGEAADVRLVEADKPASALNHVVGDTFEVARASEGDIYRLAMAGVELEVAPTGKPGAAEPAAADPEPAANEQQQEQTEEQKADASENPILDKKADGEPGEPLEKPSLLERQQAAFAAGNSGDINAQRSENEED